MKFKSINNQILLTLAVIGLIATSLFAWFVSSNIHANMMADTKAKANELIARTAQMFMVSTVQFNNAYTSAVDPEAKARIHADWTRTIAAVDKAVTHDFGTQQSRVRLFTDPQKLSIVSQGGAATYVDGQFERDALAAFADRGEAAFTRITDNSYQIAVPLFSDMHDGCANCHGVDTSLHQLFGGVGVTISLDAMQQTANERIWLTTGGLALAMLLLFVFIYFYLLRHVTTPLVRLSSQTNAITAAIESGQVNASHGVAAHQSMEIGEMANSFNRLLTVIKSLMGEIAGNSQQVNDAARETAVVAQQHRHSAVAQQQHLGHIVTAIDELANAGELVSQRAEQTAQTSDDVNLTVADGQQTMTRTVTAIQDLAGEVNKVSEVIATLDQRSDSIGSIIGTIDGIAEQTNLLALNAAIEAARAGEQGRGFAVVADEVRTLAQRTQQATSEINQLILNLQQDAQTASAVVVAGTEKADVTVNLAQSAQQMLNEITHKVTNINDMNRDIAASAEQQAVTVRDINQRLQTVSTDAKESVAAAETVARESESLKALSQQMTELTADGRR